MKMGALAKYTLVVAMVLTAGIIFFGCAGTRIQKLTGVEFQSRAKMMEQVSSFSWTTYVGHSGQRAYLEYGHPAFLGSGTRTTVFWTLLSELPQELADNLEADNPPWTPWNAKKVKGE